MPEELSMIITKLMTRPTLKADTPSHPTDHDLKLLKKFKLMKDKLKWAQVLAQPFVSPQANVHS